MGVLRASNRLLQRPADVAISDFDNSEGGADRQFVLEQLAAMERARGLLPGGPLIGVVGMVDQGQRLSARQCYETKVHNQLSFLAMQPPIFAGVNVVLEGASGVQAHSQTLVQVRQTAMMLVEPGAAWLGLPPFLRLRR